MIKTNTILQIFIPILAIIGGFFITGYWGGFLSGAAVVFLIFTTLGRWQFRKATRRIDQLQEHFYKNMIQ